MFFICFLYCIYSFHIFFCFFFFNDTATTEIYTLSLHDALPIRHDAGIGRDKRKPGHADHGRSEEHTSELQSRSDLVCRLLLEKKKKQHMRLLNTFHKKNTAALTRRYKRE